MKKIVNIILLVLSCLSLVGCTQTKNSEPTNKEQWQALKVYKYSENDLMATTCKDNLIYTIIEVTSLTKIKRMFSSAEELKGICNSGSCNYEADSSYTASCAINPNVGDYALEIYTDVNMNESLPPIDLWLHTLGKDREQAIISYQRANCKNYYELTESDTKTLKELIIHKQKSGNVSEITTKDDLVSMNLKEKSLTNVGATFILTNHTDVSYTYGSGYGLEYEEENTWYTLNGIMDNYGFDLIGYSLKPNSKEEIIINWEDYYGKLVPGKYHVEKSIDDFFVATEFIIK